MRKFDLRVEQGTLTLRWRKRGVLPALTVAVFGTTLCVWLMLLSHFVRGHGHERALRDAFSSGAAMLVVPVAYLTVGLRRLRPQTWEFSRHAGTALLNGRLIYSISEIKSIHLDKEFSETGSVTDALVLYLQTQAGSKMELAREGVFGVGQREMREVADAISEQTGADVVLKDGFIPGWRWAVTPDISARRWGPKRGRSVRQHRPKCRSLARVR